MDPVVHFEMPYRDAQRVTRFYEAAFGWKVAVAAGGLGHYLLATTAEADVDSGSPKGAINGGFFPFKADWPDQFPSVSIGVSDIHAAIDRLEKAGGQALGQPVEIPGIGLYVSFLDTEGNRNSLVQSQK